MLHCIQTDNAMPSGTGPGDGYNFCNAITNVCECQVAAGGNSLRQCCTANSNGVYGEGGCNNSCKSMHFHPSILLLLFITILRN